MHPRGDIKGKEARFHDRRLLNKQGDDRAAQSKYYWAVEMWDDRFWQTVRGCARNARVLEIGCFSGKRTVELAAEAAKVFAIDISNRAVAVTTSYVQAHGLKNVDVCVGDAESLDFADSSLDVVFCAGVLHHVNVERTLREIYRVLVPGGRAIFREPLAHNPLINAYRRFTPAARTDDEHPLGAHDLATMKKIFDSATFEYFGMCALLAAPLRDTVAGRPLRSVLNQIDNIVFNNRLLGRYCWQANIVLGRR